MENQWAVRTRDLCKAYHGRSVVDHLNLHVPHGCVYGFLGPNGAGKSTSMKMMLGLARPTSGSVELLGRKLDEESRIELLRETGSLIESPSGYLHLTARENLAIVCDLKGVSHREIDRVLDIVRLTGDANRRVGQYSLGMKQRLGIATALLGRPRLLILDEPTNGLDPAGIQEMRSLIASMPEATGATVLISSHLLGEMEQMVTQVGIIHHGKMLFEGALRDLKRHSRGDILLRVLDVPRALAALRQNGVAVCEEEGLLRLPPMEDERLAALVCALADSGAGVIGVNEQTRRLEEIFLPDQEESILLDRKSPALHLIQRVRDEAHRFGITHHRDLRQKAGMHSTLEDIPGVGATRRRALLTHFKSVANIAAATPEALCEVEGIGKAQARAIWDYYHPEEKESGGAKP